MAARAIWKGEIKLGPTRLPVKLYSAVSEKSIRFNILDKHRERVKQHMVKQDDGAEVPKEKIQKGYEVEPGSFVLLTDEDLDTIKPKPSREIAVTEFVPSNQITQQYYERPYYLAPDGDEENYFAFAEALAQTEREGVVEWVMRNKEYQGAIRSQDGYLILSTLRNSDEVVAAKGLPKPAGRAPSKEEISMARHLVSLLADEFKPAEYKDEYRERVLKFIESKARGKAPRLKLVKSKRKTTALASALKKSIAAANKAKEKRAA